MAKTKSGKQNPFDVNNLSAQDSDVLNLDTATVMKKYKMEKQAVYDRRYALKKKLKEAGSATPAAEAPVVTQKKRGPKKGQKRKPKPTLTPTEKTEALPETIAPESRALMVVSKQVPVIHKPIEINFDNFTVKLNGVPKKISVNPDTNSIEIDL